MSELERIVAPVVADLGLDLESVEVVGQGKHRRLVIAVDRDGGVGIDAIAQATRAVSAALDATDAMGQAPYTLEVTSRGADRPLTAPRHWRRNHDRLVHVTTTDGATVTARIGDSDESGVDLLRGGVPTRYAYGDIERAVIEIELNRKDV
ncbi:ribosome maturation factor RimP [Aeromicrobium sp. YIM 150415]|uniref:ribosome maturation factor RimP n=1 Tax=Aeromicrobium sp. YIM 150415 TaxID=2803912 RepID=UPI0019633EA4|nr:ribosome maturation factor RimP [Aeromicrobium sp. YIM 150415]MBM9462737.1 ribosome maturation factor RimP [Aeromicrobium sp. YIM 150415]